MFAVDDVDETLSRLYEHGGELVSSEVVPYEDTYHAGLMYRGCSGRSQLIVAHKSPADSGRWPPRKVLTIPGSGRSPLLTPSAVERPFGSILRPNQSRFEYER
jgi:hypothetical protein